MRHGARIQRMEKVYSVEHTNGGAIVHSVRAEYGVDQVVITSGTWISQLARCDDITFACKVYRQAMHWFDASASIPTFTPDRMPVFIWEFGSGDRDMFYGFPAIDGIHGGLKVATEQYEISCDPDDLHTDVTPDESQRMFDECVKGRLPLSPTVVKPA
jgi:sarcosine oxidase